MRSCLLVVSAIGKCNFPEVSTCWKEEKNEPAHEIMVLFVLRKLILHTLMRSNPLGLLVDVWYLVGPFVYFNTSCVRTAKALARLRECAGSPEPSLVVYVISTIISWAGSDALFLIRVVFLMRTRRREGCRIFKNLSWTYSIEPCLLFSNFWCCISKGSFRFRLFTSYSSLAYLQYWNYHLETWTQIRVSIASLWET